MDLHRLKVVKFDRSLEKKYSNRKEIIGDFAKDANCIIKSKYEKSRKERDHSADNMEQKVQRPFTIHKSKSEPLKGLFSKNKTFTKHVRKKSISFDEIKKNFTSKHNLFKPERLSKIKKEKEFIARNKDIKVLFASEVSRLTKRDRNVCCSTKQRNTKVGTFTKKSKPSYDIFGFQNRKCSFDHSSKQYRCDKGCVTKKFSKLQSRLNKIHKLSQSKKEPISVVEQPLLFIKSCVSKLREAKSESNCCICTRAEHYNLVCFPENNYSALRGKTSVNPKNIPVHPSAYFPDCICVNRQVSVTPSRLQGRNKNMGDAAVATTRSLCNSCSTLKRVINAPGPFCRICKIPKSIRTRRILCHTLGATKKIFPSQPTKSFEKKIRTFFKYVLLGFVIVAWIPCVLTVLICWILTYPLRPQHIKTSGCENDDCPHKKTPLSRIMGGVKCLADKAAYSIKAMLSLLRSNEEQDVLQHRATTCSRGCPDPKRKYTLFYTDHRGWRMKPIHDQNLGTCDRAVREFQDPNSTPDHSRLRNKNIVKHKCCGCKIHKTDKNLKMDTSLYHPESKKNQTQNTKCCKRLFERPQRPNDEGKSFEYRVNKPRLRSKSHPLPCEPHIRLYEKAPTKCRPCLRNSRSSPVPLNSTIARRKLKSRFTHHHCCESCEERKQYKMTSNQMNYMCRKRIKKLHPRCAGGKPWKKDKSYFKRLWYSIRSSFGKLERVIDETEEEAWEDEIKCDTLHILQKKPYPWLYQHCPCMYPCFTVWINCIKSTWHMAVYVLSCCVWCPVMFGCYIFSELFWQCLK